MSETVPARRGDPARSGAFYAFSAFLLWGFAPLYFKALHPVPPVEILAHRVVWSIVLMAVLVAAMGRASAVLPEIADRRRLGTYVLTTLLVSANWLIYIWAVNAGHVVQSSLGYYINPLVNVVLGVLFLGERLSRRQGAAVALAAAGVAAMVAGAGTVPWISLALALSFGLYALIRKKAGIDPFVGLLVETALLGPFALGWLVWLGATGTGAFGAHGAGFDLLLAAAGAVTAVPLVLFNLGAQRLRLSTIGLMQYLSPTILLLLGTLLYGEAFTAYHAVAFGLIWTGLVVYSSDAFRARRAARAAAAE